MEVSCYHFFLGSWIAIVSVPCYSGVFHLKVPPGIQLKCAGCWISTLTCNSASQTCLSIHLACLTALLKQSIWSPRLPQAMQRRSSRWAHTSFGIPLAPTMWLSGEPAVSIVSSCGSVLAPRKDDGTDFECAWIQSNGLIALEIKCYCRRSVNSWCDTVLIFGSW